MVSERTRNIFEYLCAVLNDGLASMDDIRAFISNLEELSDGEAQFLQGAFMKMPHQETAGQVSSRSRGPAAQDA